MTEISRGVGLLKGWLARSRQQQRELAGSLGITDAYLSQVLAGTRRPKLETLLEIERVTGVPVRSWAETSDSDLDEVASDTSNGRAIQRVK